MSFFQAPTEAVMLAGCEYTMRADLRAFMRIHEMVATEPERFVDVQLGAGPETAMRVEMTPANAPAYFAAFCDDAVDWPSICRRAHPLEVLRAWGVCSELLSQVEADWQPESEPPFRSESA